MIATDVDRGRTMKTVRIIDVRDESDDEIVDLAIAAARETRSSLFGWGVRRYEITPTIVTVNLYTD